MYLVWSWVCPRNTIGRSIAFFGIQALLMLSKNDNSQLTDSSRRLVFFATMRIIDLSFRRCCCW